ncbi:MAG: DUF4136 domain-containing protein [Acidobacteriaceae bacterium]|nr:DUF4136 domain-containing protein [Acidobacteriaceae bacterium]
MISGAMLFRRTPEWKLAVFLLCCVPAGAQQVKTKLYMKEPPGCFKTFHMEKGRVLTPQGLIEDPQVNEIMKDAVSAQMAKLHITEASDKSAELAVRFMGGTSYGLQVDDPNVGDIAMWNIGGPQPVSGRTYKKSSLVFGIVDSRSQQTVWAAKCTDNFGDPAHMQERIQRAVSKAFTKFPKKLACP